ncbi:gamma-aminobutyric acid type B receptor subunit 2-like [Apostichopus japonicus]|uniref:gamma-aminobutyric acid type B receptor subunit 2-like n=1 Tax=Stichopus japonicus TaxID=307972 RepID=UPI003AB2478A
MAYWYKIFLTLLFSFHLSSGDQYDFLSSISISTGINGGKIHSNKTPLFMIGFFPLQEGPMQLLGNVSKLSAELALEHINKNDNILKDFELRMIVKDSKDDEGYAVNSLFAIKNEYESNVLMIIGALRNEVSEIIARVLKYWNIPQISYGSHSPLLSELRHLPNFYRTIPPSVGMNNPRVRMMQEWNWQYVFSISSNEKVFNTISQNMTQQLAECNITLAVKDSFESGTPKSAIDLLKERDARIIIGNFYEYDAVSVFCEAFKVDLYGPGIVWLLYGHFEPNWWNPINLGIFNCTTEDMLKAIDGHFTIKFDVIGEQNVKTIGGITPDDYSDYIQNLTGVDLRVTTKPAPYAYDAVWAGALAINSSYSQLGRESLLNFSNPTFYQSEVLMSNLNSTQFDGVSGRVAFNDDGDRMGIYKITRFVNGTYVDIARYYQKEDNMEWSKTKYEIWGGEPPPDQASISVQLDKVSMQLFVAMSCISFIGMLTAAAFLVFNIHYRNERLIKMSSPNLNNLIIIGCTLCYVTIILIGIESRLSDPTICQLRTWIFTISFTLSFGAMFSKTWRVYSIFTNKKMQKRVIKDHRLFVMVGVLLLIDIIILTAWEFITQPTIVKKTITEYRDKENANLIIQVNQNRCEGQHDQYFTGFIMVYKGLLLIFGTFITWQTRNVNIPALNDSRFIGLCIYNVVIFSALGLPLSILLADNSDYTYGIIGGLIIFCTTLTLCLLFLPKVASIVQGYAPEDVGSRVMSNMNGRSSRGYSQGPPSRTDRLGEPTCTHSVSLEPTSDARLGV